MNLTRHIHMVGCVAVMVCTLSPGAVLLAQTPSSDSGSDQPAPPKTGFFSSLAQTVTQPFDPKVVRGYFDNSGRRFYCVIDTKTGANLDNAFQGTISVQPDGTQTIKTTAVSTLSCNKAEAAGVLVLTTKAGGQDAPRSSLVAKGAVASPAQGDAASGVTPLTIAAASSQSDTEANDKVVFDSFDILSMHLGMSVDQIRAAIKARHLAQYLEGKKILSFTDSTSGSPHLKPVPNGSFVNVIEAATIDPSPNKWVGQGGLGKWGEGEQILVYFTPVPGEERAAYIYHEVDLSGAHPIRETDLVKSLLDKYGSHAFRAAHSTELKWETGAGMTLGDGGTSISGGPLPVGCQHLGMHTDDTDYFGLGPREFSSTQNSDNPILRLSAGLWRFTVQCGHAVVTASWAIINPSAPPDEHLVVAYKVIASSPDMAFQASLAAGKLTQGANAASDAAAAKNAEGNKPSL